ncbi:hypothetical protein Tco_1380908 [Tanacetum coccineum]
MSTPTQCCDMGSDGYAYPVYDMFGIVDPNMQNEQLILDIVVCRKPMILAQLYVDILSIIFSTAAANLVYIIRSIEKRKDKGKTIMKEDKSVQKKAKKQLEQERLGHEEAIRLQEQINEEEKQRIARDAEIAKQLQEEFDRAGQEQEVVAEVDLAHDIDWSDPAVLRYHELQNRSF